MPPFSRLEANCRSRQAISLPLRWSSLGLPWDRPAHRSLARPGTSPARPRRPSSTLSVGVSPRRWPSRVHCGQQGAKSARGEETKSVTLKVIQWGTGTAGLRSLTCILNNPALELVGLYVARPEHAGPRDAGSFVDEPNTAVALRRTVWMSCSGSEADCLCYMGSFATGGIQDVLPFLRAGRNVVAPTLFTLLTPVFAPAEDYEPVMAACLEGGSSFFSTGASPGYYGLFPDGDAGHRRRDPGGPGPRDCRLQLLPRRRGRPHLGLRRPAGRPDPTLRGRRGSPRAGRASPRTSHVGWVSRSKRSGSSPRAVSPTRRGGCLLHDSGRDNCQHPIPGAGSGEGRAVCSPGACQLLRCDSRSAHWPRANGKGDLAYRTVIAGRPNLTAEIMLDYPVAAVRTINAIPAVVAAAPGIIAGSDVPPLNSGNVRPR